MPTDNATGYRGRIYLEYSCSQEFVSSMQLTVDKRHKFFKCLECQGQLCSNMKSK